MGKYYLTDLGKTVLAWLFLAISAVVTLVLTFRHIEEYRKLRTEVAELRVRTAGSIPAPGVGARQAWFRVGEYNGMKFYMMVEEDALQR